MTDQDTVYHTYHFFTYKEDWDETKKKLDITDEGLRDKIEEVLQIQAWADVLLEVVLLEGDPQGG